MNITGKTKHINIAHYPRRYQILVNYLHGVLAITGGAKVMLTTHVSVLDGV